MADPFIAEIVMFGGNFNLRGWARCDGQLLAISQNQALFSILGTIYGGDGRTDFALPELRGRVSMHWGSGPGLTPRVIGEKSGVESVTLNSNQIPVHNHSFNPPCSTADGTADSPANNFPATHEASAESPYVNSSNSTMGAGTTGNAGGGQSHSNIQPFLCVTYIIALTGVFPSRN